MDYKISDFVNDYKKEEDYIDNEDELSFAHSLHCAANGDVQSMRILGQAYSSEGYGVVRDYGKAIYWFQRAADCGDMNSLLSLAAIYYCYDDRDFPHDYEKAFVLYSLAAEKGNEPAVARLGIMNLYGIGCEKNYEEARRLLKSAAEDYEREACYEYALILREEGDGRWRDFLNEAAEQGYGRACFLTVKLFGDSLTDRQFIYYITSGARDELPNYDPTEAQIMCGDCFLNGIRTRKNMNAARSYYTEAALRGSEAAKEALKKYFSDGVN